MRRDFLAYFDSLFRRHGDVVRFSLPRTVHLVFHPEGVRHVLKTAHHRYKKSHFFRELEPLLGGGLLMAEGDVWRDERRQLSPVFQHKVIEGFLPAISKAADRVAAEWERAAREGRPRDVAADMTELTLSAATSIFFGTDATRDADEVSRAFCYFSDYAIQRMIDVLPSPRWLPTRANRRARRSVAALDAVVYRILDERAATSGGDDMLARLLASRDPETGKPLDRSAIRDQVMTFLLAGHETTSNALSWTWFLLEKHPDVADALAEEVRALPAGATASVTALLHCEGLKRIFAESMRLYPPAPVISRTPLEDDEILGWFIPKGTIVETCPWVTHRHPEFWERPEEFLPGRFAEERRREQHPFAYFPFGGGPRECIGKSFALVEAYLVLARLAGRFRLRRYDGAPAVVPEARITLRPKHGVWARIEERS